MSLSFLCFVTDFEGLPSWAGLGNEMLKPSTASGPYAPTKPARRRASPALPSDAQPGFSTRWAGKFPSEALRKRPRADRGSRGRAALGRPAPNPVDIPLAPDKLAPMRRKRKFLSVAMWLLVSTAGSVLAAGSANQRWAIVATDGVRERGVVDLLTAQLSQVGRIELVEPDAIQRVLDELKLNAGGLVNRRKALQFGQLLAADALLCVQENKAAGNSLGSLRLVETRTGVRLCELLTSFGDRPDQWAAPWLEEWRRAKAVLELPHDARRYVGVIGIQSEEPGSALTSLVRTLSVFWSTISRRLPGVVVLEREHLRLLRQEQQLTGVELELRSSAWLIEGGLRRNEGKN